MQQPAVRTSVTAVILFLTCALLVRAYLQQELGALGVGPAFAKDLSYLVVPVILAVLLLPVVRANKSAVRGFLSGGTLTLRLVLIAIAIGLLARAASWCRLVFSIATGITSNSDPAAIVGPVFRFSCPPAGEFLLGLLVWICLIPVVEEFVHRGLIQSSLMRHGRVTAIVMSALIFAAFHLPAAMPVALLMGVIFAIQFAQTGTLWIPVITHATYDGVIQFDWRCLNGAWNPPASATPLVEPAVWSLVGLCAAIGAIALLLRRTGAPDAPRSGSR